MKTFGYIVGFGVVLFSYAFAIGSIAQDKISKQEDCELSEAIKYEETLATYGGSTFVMRKIDENNYSIEEQVDLYEEYSKNKNYYALYYDGNNVYRIDKKIKINMNYYLLIILMRMVY